MNHKHADFTFQSGYIQMYSVRYVLQVSSMLYIPIWLYSNQKQPKKVHWRMSLYIPIWLYSNHISLLPYPHHPRFTFQSGYIQIKFKAFSRYNYIWFTFQSGYIQILVVNYYFRKFSWFTFQSGYIQISALSLSSINSILFTFQSGYIQMFLLLKTL